jgi:hypothetical protein
MAAFGKLERKWTQFWFLIGSSTREKKVKAKFEDALSNPGGTPFASLATDTTSQEILRSLLAALSDCDQLPESINRKLVQ